MRTIRNKSPDNQGGRLVASAATLFPQHPTTHIASDFWAPIPSASGDYYLKLRVFAAGEHEDTARTFTPDFH